MSRDDDDAFPPCVFCEKKVRTHEPFIMVGYLAGGARDLPAVGNAPLHLACQMKAIAGEAARAVAALINKGEIEIGLDRDEDDDLGEVVRDITMRVVGEFTDPGRARRRARR